MGGVLQKEGIRMKKKTPEQELKELCRDIRREIDHWEYINQYGCNDPFWPDGENMNLTRNHIIYDKHQIEELCEKNGLRIPEEVYLPTPPEVDPYYMANLKERRRVERLKQLGDGGKLTTKKNKYDREQLSLF